MYFDFREIFDKVERNFYELDEKIIMWVLIIVDKEYRLMD